MRRTFVMLTAGWISLLAASTTLAQPEVLSADRMARHLLDRWPVNLPVPVTSLDQAYAYQSNLVAHLAGEYGEPAGYKAALTSEAMQKRFRHDRPVLGVVLKNMLLRDRVILDAGFATRPLVEADLMVLVANNSINEAATHEELLAAIEGIHPIIELPDMVFMEGVNILPLWLTAINAGARAAVVGDPVLARGNTNLIERLGRVQASVLDKQGQVLATGNSDALMGHPLNVVRWIRDEVIARGGRLKAGDVLWLGSLTPPIPAMPGESYQVLFTGLNEYPVSIQVNIRGASR